MRELQRAHQQHGGTLVRAENHTRGVGRLLRIGGKEVNCKG